MKEEACDYEEQAESDDMTVLFQALRAAHKAFYDKIEELGFDGAFWRLYPLQGCAVSVFDFKKQGSIIYDPDSWQYKEGEI